MNELLVVCWSVIVGTSTLNFHAPKHDAEQNELCLVALHNSLWPESCYGVQTFCCQSEGLHMQDQGRNNAQASMGEV